MKAISMLKILFITYLCSALMIIVLSFVLYKFSLDSNKLSLGVILIYAISCFIGGFMSGRVSENKKYLWGIICGLTYVVILIILSFLINGNISMSLKNVLLQLGICTGSSMIGGMLA